MFTSSHTLAAAAHHVVLHAKVDSLSITTVTTAKAVVAVFPKRRKKTLIDYWSQKLQRENNSDHFGTNKSALVFTPVEKNREKEVRKENRMEYTF